MSQLCIILCQFCDVHGPSVTFCTRASQTLPPCDPHSPNTTHTQSFSAETNENANTQKESQNSSVEINDDAQHTQSPMPKRPSQSSLTDLLTNSTANLNTNPNTNLSSNTTTIISSPPALSASSSSSSSKTKSAMRSLIHAASLPSGKLSSPPSSSSLLSLHTTSMHSPMRATHYQCCHGPPEGHDITLVTQSKATLENSPASVHSHHSVSTMDLPIDAISLSEAKAIAPSASNATINKDLQRQLDMKTNTTSPPRSSRHNVQRDDEHDAEQPQIMPLQPTIPHVFHDHANTSSKRNMYEDSVHGNSQHLHQRHQSQTKSMNTAVVTKEVDSWRYANDGYQHSTRRSSFSSATAGSTASSLPTPRSSALDLDLAAGSLHLRSPHFQHEQPLPTRSLCYITTRQPPMDLLASCRNSCIKSLSIEAASERVDPLVFCDGAVASFSFAFRLKDQQARGFHRWYSIVCIVEDFSTLMWCWGFLQESFKKYSSELQQSAEAVFAKEGRNQPQSMGRVTGRSPMLPPPNMQRRPAPSQRTVEEVVGLKNLIGTFHTYMAWVLASLEGRYSLRTLGRTSQHYYNYLPRCANASQLIPYSNTNDPMKDLVGLHQLTLLLGDDGMKHVLYNLLIGNQVIVRGDHSYMIHRIVRILKTTLPDNVLQIVENSKVYRPAYECNLLALTSMSYEIPSDMDPSSFALIDVDYRRDVTNGTRIFGLFSQEQTSRYSFLRFKVHAKNYKRTVIGKKLEALCRTRHDPKYEAVAIEQLKAEWSSKAKLFAAFARHAGSEKEERRKLFLDSMKIGDADVLILKFWSTGIRPRKDAYPFPSEDE
eukprot:TRINITY_DN5145_c0_g1_i13.p1 TRINITY_DN5145_c0_g1~~TRINITY_DN5145_c0_g1_i13.p1  ORF type:complete len:825 (-),score=172.86 TRINITY_DN5145_c0_g1_i13:2692-5166(-)